MLVAGRPSYPSLMFASEVSSLPSSGAPEKVLHSGKLDQFIIIENVFNVIF